MAAKTFTDFKDSFRLEYGRLPTLKETWKAAKRAEALKPSHNTQSDAIIANIKEYLIERAQQHDDWWLDDWVEHAL